MNNEKREKTAVGNLLLNLGINKLMFINQLACSVAQRVAPNQRNQLGTINGNRPFSPPDQRFNSNFLQLVFWWNRSDKGRSGKVGATRSGHFEEQKEWRRKCRRVELRTNQEKDERGENGEEEIKIK